MADKQFCYKAVSKPGNCIKANLKQALRQKLHFSPTHTTKTYFQILQFFSTLCSLHTNITNKTSTRPASYRTYQSHILYLSSLT